MKGQTSKPCPGCGKQKMGYAGRPVAFRPTDGVCHDCREKLDDYDRMKEIFEKGPDLIEVELPWSWWNPPLALPAVGGRPFEGRDDPVKVLGKVFHHFLYRGLAVKVWKRKGNSWGDDNATTDMALVPRLAYRWFWRLHRVAGLALRRANENGVQHGHNWLQRLSTGEVSVEDFSSVVDRHSVKYHKVGAERGD